MVEYYGHLNFDSPELCSDLFFVQESSLLTRDILIYFGLPRAPITNEEWNEIKGHGMSAVVINSRAAATPYVPVFKHKRRQDKGGWQINKLKDKKIFSFINGYNTMFQIIMKDTIIGLILLHNTILKYMLPGINTMLSIVPYLMLCRIQVELGLFISVRSNTFQLLGRLQQQMWFLVFQNGERI